VTEEEEEEEALSTGVHYAACLLPLAALCVGAVLLAGTLGASDDGSATNCTLPFAPALSNSTWVNASNSSGHCGWGYAGSNAAAGRQCRLRGWTVAFIFCMSAVGWFFAWAAVGVAGDGWMHSNNGNSVCILIGSCASLCCACIWGSGLLIAISVLTKPKPENDTAEELAATMCPMGYAVSPLTCDCRLAWWTVLSFMGPVWFVSMMPLLMSLKGLYGSVTEVDSDSIPKQLRASSDSMVGRVMVARPGQWGSSELAVINFVTHLAERMSYLSYSTNLYVRIDPVVDLPASAQHL
jgi:hypothetical protein